MAIEFRGLDLTSPINRIKAGFAAMCQNVRAYFKGGFALRNLLTDAIVTVADAIETICRWVRQAASPMSSPRVQKSTSARQELPPRLPMDSTPILSQ